ncbi:hypothetical protein BU17DRAFT_60078 [Hysterangium stoloniferum]|nr:hypothetical protein BU17DRAFT_60078 [Hysterangium stoloniferum]
MARELVVADDERVSMAWEDVAEGGAEMMGWRCGREVAPGLETGAGISENLAELAVEEASLHTASSHSTMSGLCRLSTELQVAYSTSNGISTSGTCKFARDGPSYAIRITEMDMDLYFCEEWYMTVSSPFSVLTSPSTAPPGTCSSYHSTVQSGSRSGSRFATLDSVLILSDVRVTDEVVKILPERSLLLPSRLSHSEEWPYFPHTSA